MITSASESAYFTTFGQELEVYSSNFELTVDTSIINNAFIVT